MDTSWFTISNAAEVASPALLVYPDRVEENIRRMIRMAGGAERLRPHIKTNKLPEVIRMQMDHGITKFKCATIAEAGSRHAEPRMSCWLISRVDRPRTVGMCGRWDRFSCGRAGDGAQF